MSDTEKAQDGQVEETSATSSAPAKASKKKTTSKKSSSKKAAAVAIKIVEENPDGTKRLIVDPSVTKGEYVEQVLADPDILAALIDALCGSARRARQFSATIVGSIAKVNPQVLVPSVNSLLDALHRPEAQTRWEILDALYELASLCSDECEEGIAGAEASLYDEESGPARLAAFRFLCGIGATSAERSKRVWPYLDEAIQCYHGDLEYQDMLGELVRFAGSAIDGEVKSALAARVKFDADNGKGALQHKSQSIVDACGK